MKLILKPNTDLITSFALSGDLEGSFEFDGVVPEKFVDYFEPEKYMIRDGLIVENIDFSVYTPTSENNYPNTNRLIANLYQQTATNQLSQLKANANLLQQVAALTRQVADLHTEKGTTNV